MSNYFIFILNDAKEKESECIKMCRAILISEVIINKFIEKGYPLNTSKLQKILYYMQKEHLRKYNSPIFNEKIVAWKCGPAIREIDEFFVDGKLGFHTYVEQSIILKDSHQDVLDTIFDKYGEILPSDIIKTSQLEASWISVWDDGQGFGKEIPLEIIMPILERNNDIVGE